MKKNRIGTQSLLAAAFSIILVGVALGGYQHSPGGDYGMRNCGPGAVPNATRSSCGECCAGAGSGQNQIDCQDYCAQITPNSLPACNWLNLWCMLTS